MKVYVSALFLTFEVFLHFGVSSSMPSSPPNQPTSPPRNEGTSEPHNRPMYIPRDQDRPVLDKNTGELVAIYYNERRINISDIIFEEKDPDLIPDRSRLIRLGPPDVKGIFFQHKVYYSYELRNSGVTIEPQRNDIVMDPTAFRIKGVFRDDGHYYEIVRRMTRAHKWVLP